jgi:bifunctional non-homologous end joining protein LigD
MPKAVRGIRVEERGGSAEYISVADAEGLLGLVQFGVIEFHPWGSRGDLLDRPDRIVIDLDPAPDVAWAQVVAGARRLRELLQALKLESFARTTGGKGLHVVVPIERRSSWEEVKTFTRELAAVMAREEPEHYVLVASKQQRKGRIFIDYLRNDHGATAVASWSARVRAGATVAMPLRWQEVTAKLEAAAFTVPGIALRLPRADPWAGFAEVRQSLTGGLHGRLRKG